MPVDITLSAARTAVRFPRSTGRHHPLHRATHPAGGRRGHLAHRAAGRGRGPAGAGTGGTPRRSLPVSWRPAQRLQRLVFSRKRSAAELDPGYLLLCSYAPQAYGEVDQDMLRFRTARFRLRKLALICAQEAARKLSGASQSSSATAPPIDNSPLGKYNWVREPTISIERRQELGLRLLIKPDVQLYHYPFAELKLSRADIEWLLLTHENGLGPVDWKSPARDERWGIDLRGADIRGVDLQELPLTRLRGGLSGTDWNIATQEQRDRAAVIAHKTVFTYAHLEGAVLTHAHLEGAQLNHARLEDVDAYGIHLGGPTPANLYGAYLSPATKLYRAVLANKEGVGPRLLHVHWNNAHLAGIEWNSMRYVTDEHVARRLGEHGTTSHAKSCDYHYEEALLTYRELSAVLLGQGLNEESAKFENRANTVQRILFFRRRQVLQYGFSLVLNVTTGYGYRMWRSLITYGVTIAAFACGYYFLTTGAGVSLSAVEATVLSVTSFHGCGFMAAQNIGLSHPILILGAAESLVGLIIEIILIATVTRRLFGK